MHDYYHKLMSQTRPAKGGIHPVVLKVDTTPVTGKVDIKVYTPLTVNIGKRCVEGTMPLWLQTEVIYSDADSWGVFCITHFAFFANLKI